MIFITTCQNLQATWHDEFEKRVDERQSLFAFRSYNWLLISCQLYNPYIHDIVTPQQDEYMYVTAINSFVPKSNKCGLKINSIHMPIFRFFQNLHLLKLPCFLQYKSQGVGVG